MKTHVTAAAMALATILSTCPSLAGPPPPPEGPPGFEAPGDFPSPEARERVRKRIETIRLWKLTEELELDEATAARLFPLLSRYDRERHGVEEGIRESMAEMRNALGSGQSGRLAELIDGLESGHRELQGLKDREFQEIRSVLSLEQQAKFILFTQQFGRQMRRFIDEAREGRREDRRDDRREDRRDSPSPRTMPPQWR